MRFQRADRWSGLRTAGLRAPDERAPRELLRALASDSIRRALEGHFGVRLAFQNCQRVAVFRPGAEDGAAYREFTSVRAQLLNQRPELVNC